MTFVKKDRLGRDYRYLVVHEEDNERNGMGGRD